MKDIIAFFDQHAQHWDSYQKEEEIPIIREIIARCEIEEREDILDVACGTGVLIPFFYELGVLDSQIQANDISSEMCHLFSQKYPDIKVFQGDFTEENFSERFYDLVIIFNSFPHFIEPAKVFRKAAQILKIGGKFVVAHSMTRELLDEFHRKTHGVVCSHRLISDEKFMEYFREYGFTEEVVENQNYFFAKAKKSK